MLRQIKSECLLPARGPLTKEPSKEYALQEEIRSQEEGEACKKKWWAKKPASMVQGGLLACVIQGPISEGGPVLQI